MNHTQTLPGLSLPTQQEAQDSRLQKAIDVIVKHYGGNMGAYFDQYFAEQRKQREEAEKKEMEAFRKMLLQRKAVAA